MRYRSPTLTPAQKPATREVPRPWGKRNTFSPSFFLSFRIVPTQAFVATLQSFLNDAHSRTKAEVRYDVSASKSTIRLHSLLCDPLTALPPMKIVSW